MKYSITAMIVLITVLISYADFSDDFSDPAQSNNLWISSFDELNVAFTSGQCKVTNESDEYAGFAYHLFGDNEKPSEFTLSANITLNNENMAAGFICRLSTANPISGYFVTISSTGVIGVQKYSSTVSGDVLFNGSSAYLTQGVNNLKVSMKDGTMNISCNGKCVGTCIDESGELASGDIALLVSPGGEAVVDDVVMTSVFEECKVPTCFADTFENADLPGWRQFGNENAEVRVDDGAMRITTDTTEYIYKVVDLPLDNFVMQVHATLRNTNSTSLYGLFLVGEPESDEAYLPVANFGIIGNKSYNVMLSGSSAQPKVSTSIKGNPYIGEDGDTTFYTDTLEVIKREGSTEYFFIVNTDTIEKFSDVDFEVTGVGIFCQQQLDVSFDNFLAVNGTEYNCPVSNPLRYSARERLQAIKPFSTPQMFDLSGRLLRRNVHSFDRKVPSGIYIIRNQRNVQTRIKQ